MIYVYDDVIINPDLYVEQVLKTGFIDVTDSVNVFKGIQPRGEDEAQNFITNIFEGYNVCYNFIRQSPHMQEEPNFIHSDEMMGDLTVLLYLNKEFPDGSGTTIYDKNKNKKFTVHMNYNIILVLEIVLGLYK